MKLYFVLIFLTLLSISIHGINAESDIFSKTKNKLAAMYEKIKNTSALLLGSLIS